MHKDKRKRGEKFDKCSSPNANTQNLSHELQSCSPLSLNLSFLDFFNSVSIYNSYILYRKWRKKQQQKWLTLFSKGL